MKYYCLLLICISIMSYLRHRFSMSFKLFYYDITEILLKVALNTIKPTNNQPIHDRSLSRYFYKEWRVKTSLMSTKNSSRTMPIICIIYRKIPEVRTTTDGVLRDHSKDRVKMWNINLRNDDRFTHYNQGRSQRLYLCYSAS